LYVHYKFSQRVQTETETFEQCVTELRILIKDCDYQQKDEMLRDQIVFTVRSPKIGEKLIDEGSDLTLEKAIDIARTYELSKQQLTTMNGEDTSINAISRKPAQRTQPQANCSQRTKGMTEDEYVRPKYVNSQKTRRNRNYCGKC
jgi:hypothetical protein